MSDDREVLTYESFGIACRELAERWPPTATGRT